MLRQPQNEKSSLRSSHSLKEELPRGEKETKEHFGEDEAVHHAAEELKRAEEAMEKAKAELRRAEEKACQRRNCENPERGSASRGRV